MVMVLLMRLFSRKGTFFCQLCKYKILLLGRIINRKNFLHNTLEWNFPNNISFLFLFLLALPSPLLMLSFSFIHFIFTFYPIFIAGLIGDSMFLHVWCTKANATIKIIPYIFFTKLLSKLLNFDINKNQNHQPRISFFSDNVI